jgi:hypothetical protein
LEKRVAEGAERSKVIKSIIFKLTSFVIIISIFQAILLVVTIVVGGVLSEGKEIAYSYLYDKVSKRKDYRSFPYFE